MHKTYSLILLTALVMQHPYAHEADSSRSVSAVVLEDVGFSLTGVGRYYTAPLRFSLSAWAAAGGMVAASCALMAVDKQVYDAVDATGRNSYNGDWWDVPTIYGDFAGAGGVAILTYGAGLIAGSGGVRTTGRVMLESLGSAGLAAFTMRYLAGRSRPFAGAGPWNFHPVGWMHDHQSFPSGHATAAFAFSTVLAERTGTAWSRILFYGVGTVAAAARVRNNQHWTSDVAMGALLGISAGVSAVKREEERNGIPRSQESNLKILPNGRGVSMVYILP
jgi:membrane-associated phospholipid phosphatase